MGRLEGKVAVVTGGGNGIGRASCERFAEEGADVVVADLLEAPSKEVVAAVEAKGRHAIFHQLDATSAEDNEAAMQRALDELGGLDILVTSAGVSSKDYVSGQVQHMTTAADPAEMFCNFPIEDWNVVLGVNLTGTLLAMQSAAKRMKAGSSIITIASIAAKQPEAGTPSYSVSKAGVWMLTKFASLNLASAGIRVNSIGPGFIDTNMTKVLSLAPEAFERFRAHIPMGRMGAPIEIANTAVFIASDESSYTTGEIFHVDGGYYTE
jgi:NAD(P)-dependent dehydrogenase (short-subunit alcohol dehydrogenase family)